MIIPLWLKKLLVKEQGGWTNSANILMI